MNLQSLAPHVVSIASRFQGHRSSAVPHVNRTKLANADSNKFISARKCDYASSHSLPEHWKDRFPRPCDATCLEPSGPHCDSDSRARPLRQLPATRSLSTAFHRASQFSAELVNSFFEDPVSFSAFR
jgi:hypothetical protein